MNVVATNLDGPLPGSEGSHTNSLGTQHEIERIALIISLEVN